MSDLTNLGTLPLATVSATMMYQILGPSCKYLGTKGADYSQVMVSNLERMFQEAHKRLGNRNIEEGEVPPRLLKAALDQGAYTEDVVASCYLGGVLASSKSEYSRDDRGVSLNATISRLSTYQIRCHYVLYSCMFDLHQGMSFRTVVDLPEVNGLVIGMVGFALGMGITTEEMQDPEFDFYSVVEHTFFGLDREGLIVDWAYGGKQQTVTCCPTALGLELFLWANGAGKRPLGFFYSQDFTPHEIDEVGLVQGRNVELHDPDTGEAFVVDGYDYRLRAANQSCKLPAEEP